MHWFYWFTLYYQSLLGVKSGVIIKMVLIVFTF